MPEAGLAIAEWTIGVLVHGLVESVHAAAALSAGALRSPPEARAVASPAPQLTVRTEGERKLYEITGVRYRVAGAKGIFVASLRVNVRTEWEGRVVGQAACDAPPASEGLYYSCFRTKCACTGTLPGFLGAMGLLAERQESDLAVLLGLLAAWNGRVLNVAAVSRELGVTRRTGAARLRALERYGRVRLLPFFGGGKKRLLYLTESFTGACVQTLVSRIREVWPESRFYWWKTGRVRRIDLLVVTRQHRIGFRFCEDPLLHNRDWWPLRIAHRQGIIHRGFVLYPGSQAFVVARVVQAIPLGAFMKEMEAWIQVGPTEEAAREARSRINVAML